MYLSRDRLFSALCTVHLGMMLYVKLTKIKQVITLFFYTLIIELFLVSTACSTSEREWLRNQFYGSLGNLGPYGQHTGEGKGCNQGLSGILPIYINCINY